MPNDQCRVSAGPGLSPRSPGVVSITGSVPPGLRVLSPGHPCSPMFALLNAAAQAVDGVARGSVGERQEIKLLDAPAKRFLNLIERRKAGDRDSRCLLPDF